MIPNKKELLINKIWNSMMRSQCGAKGPGVQAECRSS